MKKKQKKKTKKKSRKWLFIPLALIIAFAVIVVVVLLVAPLALSWLFPPPQAESQPNQLYTIAREAPSTAQGIVYMDLKKVLASEYVRSETGAPLDLISFIFGSGGVIMMDWLVVRWILPGQFLVLTPSPGRIWVNI